MIIQELIDAYADLNIEQTEPTVFDILNLNNRENAISDVLAFFLKTEEVHGLSDLFIKAFLECLGIDYASFTLDNIKVIREYPLANLKRIDIVVVSDDFVLGIENKVHAGDYNDLRYYLKALKNLAEERKEVYAIVFSAFPRNSHSGFDNMDHTLYAKKIEEIYVRDKYDASQKYQSLYNDLLINMNRMKNKMINDELFEFFKKPGYYKNAVRLPEDSEKFKIAFMTQFQDELIEKLKVHVASLKVWGEVFYGDYNSRYANIGVPHRSGLFSFYIESDTFFKGIIPSWGFVQTQILKEKPELKQRVSELLSEIFEELNINEKGNNWLCNRRGNLKEFSFGSLKFMEEILTNRERKIKQFLEKLTFITNQLNENDAKFKELLKG
jgi:hypothetical protein